MSSQTVATLSAIPPRFDRLQPALESLLNQETPFDEIRLYIPKTYRRFPDWNGDLPSVPEGVKIVRCDFDYGPATKILPAARDLNGQNVDILFCDDDKIYDRNWHNRFRAARRDHPDACIVEAGETFPDIADDIRAADRLPRGYRRKKNLGYRLIRIATLTMHKPHMYINSGFVDQLSGYGGVLVKPDWFDDLFYDIPDVLWTVDDPWLSGHLERRGIPIWLNGKGKRPHALGSGRLHALLKVTENGHGRVDADLAAIEYFRRTYGIWTPGGSTDNWHDSQKNTASMKALRLKSAT